MTRKQFEAQFAVTFLATWAANNYADACTRIQHARIEQPPVEDAEHLAGCAADEVERVGGMKWEEE